jgi:CBS domain-containing protein
MRMLLEHVMSRDPVLVHRDDQISDVASTMRDRRVSSVLVLNDAGGLCGILTERDLTHKLVAEGRSPAGFNVGQLMTSDPITASPNDRTWEAAARMHTNGIRHLPVVRDGVPIGIVSIRNLVGHDRAPQPVQNMIAGLHETSRERTLDVPALIGGPDPGDIIVLPGVD